jgi:hypothetical protein
MPKSTNRRTSLQPVFEPFDLLESSPLMMPSILTSPPANGFHSEEIDDEPSSSFNGHHGEKQNGIAVNGDAANRNGAMANGAVANGAAANGAVANGLATNGVMANGLASDDQTAHSTVASNGILNVSPPIALKGAGDYAQMASAIPSEPIPSRNIARPGDAASQNGHAHLNGGASLNGNAGVGHSEANGTEVNKSERNGSDANGSDANGSARIPVASAPPVVEIAPPQSSVETAFNAPPVNAPAAAEREPHPASGSLFTPYLVTEIRELRERRQRRRSWWRRIFG